MQFQSYRVVHRIHLGGLDKVLDVGSIVQFNGSTLKTEDGTEIKLTEASAIAGAIKIGWLVKASSEENSFVPKSAGIQVHSAKSSGEKRQTVNIMTVHDEEQNMGNRKEVRQNSSGFDKSASVSRNSEEGVVVSRVKNPAKAPPVEMGTGHQAVLQSLETKPLSVERLRLNKPTGDVAEAISGDEIEDLLPDAATARPPMRVYANDGVRTSSGGSSVGGQEDGVVIGKVGGTQKATPSRHAVQEDEEEETLLPEDPIFREKALRRWAQTGKTWNGQPVSLRDLSLLALTVLSTLDSVRSAQKAEVATSNKPAPAQQAPASFAGEFAWDLTAHWKTRKAGLLQYSSDPETLRSIYALESSGGVKKAIEAMLQDLGESLS